MSNIKIDIITLHAVQNYGSVLQAFATQELFKQHDADAEIINYIKKENRYKNLLQEWGKGNVLRMIAIYPSIIKWRKVFKKFVYAKLNLSQNTYYTNDDFTKYPINADAYCTGSDQVWNSKWNDGILRPLYLSFAPDNSYKFSFSASIGNSNITEYEVEQTKKYFERYNSISVREESARKVLIEKYHIKNVTRILDPTLCLNSEFWSNIETNKGHKGNYILVFKLKNDSRFDTFARELSKRSGLKLIRLCTRYDQLFRCGKSVVIPSVSEFLGLIHGAKFLLTDSFHATAFAINFGVHPLCVYPDEFSNRIDGILELFDLKQCKVRDYNDYDVINREYDRNAVNRILAREREKSNNYIDTIFDEIRSRNTKA